MSAWQPIETAPRDGSDIVILAHGMVIQARYVPGEWSEDSPVSPAEYDGAIWCAFDDALQFEVEEGAGENGSDWHDQCAAQGTEAQRAETENTGSVHDGPVVADDAPITGMSDQEGA